MKNIMSLTLPKVFALLVLGAVQLGGPALAQATPGSEDLRALRFYMQNNETAAVEAEINRLRAEFPGWNPPANLNALTQTQPDAEVADIYARLARGDIEGARRVIQTTQARYPTWEIPTDLARQIEMAEAQLGFDRAVNSRDIAQALRIGKKVPALFRCDRINNVWNLAELQIATGNPARALAAYSQTVRTCTTIPDLVATIEKAEAVTTDAQLTGLTDVAIQRFPAQTATFTALNLRLLAGRGGAKPAAAAPAAPAPAATAPTQVAAAQPAPAAPAIPAVQLAAPSIPSTATPATALPRSGDKRLAQTRAAKEAGAFRDCLARSARPASLDIAYERAWCAYNLERPLEAMAYFQAAARGGLGSTVSRDAAFGLTLSMLKQGMTDSAAEVAARTDFTMDQRREVEIIILDQRGVAAYLAEDNRAAIDYLNALEQLQGSLRRDLAIMRGYAYLRMGRRAEARAQFQALHDALATDETRQALSASR